MPTDASTVTETPAETAHADALETAAGLGHVEPGGGTVTTVEAGPRDA